MDYLIMKISIYKLKNLSYIRLQNYIVVVENIIQIHFILILA